jgi:glucuronate isomerase
MRANGISEEYITGNVSDAEKFTKWANTVPYTFRNPLFHWTHLELQRYFGIREILNHESAASVYQAANEQLAEAACSPRSLLTWMRIRSYEMMDFQFR